MRVRLVAGSLWFVATLLLWELGWSAFDLPRVVGPVLASVIALFVVLDPTHRIWKRTPALRRRAIRPPSESGSGSELAPLG